MLENKTLADKQERLSRRAELEAAGGEVRLPDCAADFLIVQLLEIGPVVPAGMGSAAMGWRELHAWQACTGVSVPPWQARLLIELAREYNGFSQQATKPDCPPPWAEEAQIESRREAVAKSLRIGLRALMAASSKKGA